VSQGGSAPGDGWIGDGYRPGTGCQARIASIVDRLLARWIP
jgi:hypothetical protein